MRSRLAITALLATGALMSSGGAALGVSALSTDLSASAAQYGVAPAQIVAGSQNTAPAAAPQDTTAVLGASAENTAPSDDSDVAAETTSSSPTAAAQPARQVSASQASELPFTGYAAIPLLLMGLALLAAGLVLRRSTRRAPDQA